MNNRTLNQIYPLNVSSVKNYLILFLLWPFLAFLVALNNYSQKESRKVVYIYLIYFGLTFVISQRVFTDAVGYANDFQANALRPFSDFFKIVGGIYATDTSVDIIEPLISFIVSRVTDNNRILFAVYAAIFGFFYLRSINQLHNRYQENPGQNALVHLAFFVVIIPITSINGFRMWTAAWIFFYGAYHAILYHDRRYLLFALGSSLVHWSFLSANVVLIIYFFVGNRNYIYLPIALASFVLPNLLGPVFQSMSLLLGGGIQGRFNNYSGVDYMTVRQEMYETASWFLKLGNNLIFYYLLLAIIIIQLKYGHLMKEKAERNLFSFLLLFLSFINFGKAIPSFGSRFQLVFFLFATLFIFLFFIKLPDKKVHFLTWLGLFPMILYAVVSFRQVSGLINAWIFTPGFGLPLLVPDLSVADLLFN